MKKYLPLVLFGLLCLISIYFYQISPNTQSVFNHQKEQKRSDSSKIELPKKTRIDKAMEQEFEMTRDPASNTVPRKKLLVAKRYAKQRNAVKSEIPGIVWEERGPDNIGGRTRALLFDANDSSGETVWAGSVGGGIWKTTNISDAAPTWTQVDDFFENIAVTTIAQDPSNPDIIYFGTGEGWYNLDAIRGLGIWKTTDGGNNWTRLPATANGDFNYIQKIVVKENGDVFACTRNGGIQRSSNNGDSWTKVLGSGLTASTNRAADLEIAANGTLFAAMGILDQDGIYRSFNNGNNWTKLTDDGLPENAYSRIELACAPSNANYVYAIFENTSDGMSKGIYVTQNGGNTWSAVTNPSAIGMSKFTRNQAWYDLSMAVDPNNPQRVFIGGIDLLVTDDGGQTWDQVSQWYGGNGLPYVHADQHVAIFYKNSSSRILFGNDGGVFLSTNANTNSPSFASKNNGYNVTQYYACAIHPEDEKSEYLAGAQDNGTQRYTSDGINTTSEVSGGDGCFVHIDQDNPAIQISSYVYNSYYITNNNWSSDIEREIGDQDGRFVNPTDYDDDANILYGCFSAGRYSYITDVGGTNTTGSRSISSFSGSIISAVTVSKQTPNRVFFGLSNGTIVRVDNAHNDSASGTLIRNGSGYISCIAIDDSNEDHLLVTYSNYGITSVFETTNAGNTWTNVEGNLPDMPVRWAMFSPVDSDQALLATEVGVWSTNDLNGGSTDWAPSNTGLANTRVDMLQYRASDNQVIAATHGRGLFSTNSFKVSQVNVQIKEMTHLESDITNVVNNCQEYRDIEIPIKFSLPPSEAVDVTISLNESSTATPRKDYEIMNNVLAFSPTGNLAQNVVIRVYNDAVVEETETIQFNLVAGDYVGIANTFTLTINDDDQNPTLGNSSVQAIVGAGMERQDNGPFGGLYEDNKTQMLYTTDELTAQGMTSGALTSLSFLVETISSPGIYNNFSVRLKNTALTALNGGSFETDFTEVYSDNISLELGWNQLIFNTPFTWDGTSNLLIETCFNNTDWTQDDEVRSTLTSFPSIQYTKQDDAIGCNLTTAQGTNNTRPNIRFQQNSSIGVASAMTSNMDTYVTINQNGPSHFYDTDGNIIASIEQKTGTDIGCVNVSIERIGTSIQNPEWITPYGISDKAFVVSADNDADYEITLYFSDDELAEWADEKLILNMLKTEGSIDNANMTNSQIALFDAMEINTYGDANNISYKASFNGFSSFALTNAPLIALPVELLEFSARHQGKYNVLNWTTASETNNKGFEIERSFDGRNFESIDFVKGNGSSNVEAKYVFEDGDLYHDGLYYYRLKQVDFDGRFSYSEIEVVEVKRSKEAVLISPNPVKDQFQLSWNAKDDVFADLQLFGRDGRLIQVLKSGIAQGIHPIDLSKFNLAPGIYMLRLQSSEGTILHVERLVIL